MLTGLACCDDSRTVLVTLVTNVEGGTGEVRKLRIDGSGATAVLTDAGSLLFSGDVDEFAAVRQVVCLPGSQFGMALVAIGNGPFELVSFSLDDMQVADRVPLQGKTGIGIAACCEANRIYVRSGNNFVDDYLECFTYNVETGEIGDAPEWTARLRHVAPNFLRNPLIVTADCAHVIAIEDDPAAFRVFDANTGEDVGTDTFPGLAEVEEPDTITSVSCCLDLSDPPPPDDDDDDDEDLFVKEIIDGPDRNNDGEIDRAIDVKSRTPSEFTFRITFRQSHLPEGAVCIEDCVPWPWEVVECVSDDPDGDLILVFPAGKYHDEDEDLERRHAPQVVEAQASRPKRRRGKRGLRDTVIQWYPSTNDATLTCTIRTRPKSKSRRKFLPRKCGCLLINKGARAIDTSTSNPLLDADGLPLKSNDLFVAAMKDKDGDKRIDYTGNGDEDEDGLTDYEECERGTDPCDKDTDGDKVKDGQDPDPLDKNVPGRKRRRGR